LLHVNDQPAKRLTEFSHGAGCACKLAPGLLADVLGTLGRSADPALLVGTETGDDAAVWRLDDGRALVATTDFFTPLVDDARTWGRIAATNAVSDVYAMGGRPLFALNLVAWPTEELPGSLLAEVLAGGAEVGAACGFAVVGGHSVDDPEPKYGMAVVGEVHPDRLLRNSGLRDGDTLVLTKALGTGIVTTAIKRGVAPAEVTRAAVDSMLTPNATAAEVAVRAGCTGCTDVTGFGLLGHLQRMAEASRVDVDMEVSAVPLLPGVRALAQDGVVPGGSRRNLDWVADRLEIVDGVGELDVLVLADAQTSGGLLFGVAAEGAESVLGELREAGAPAAVIGRASTGTGRITLH
jgi:selenide, water dikinase